MTEVQRIQAELARLEAKETALVAGLQAEEDEAVALGFPPQRPFFKMGTELIDVGKAKYRESRRSFDNMMFANEACEGLASTIIEEEREDIIVQLRRASMDEDGRLCVDGGKVPLELPAFASLTEHIGIPKAAYLTECPAELRAHNVNAWMEIQAARNREKALVLRTRKGATGERTGFAVVSPGYAAVGADTAALLLAALMPPHAKGTVDYDGTRARITALFHAPAEMDARVGSNYKAGVQIHTGDTGATALTIRALMYQAMCINLTTAERAQVERMVHRGTIEALENKLIAAIQRAQGKVMPFVNRWLEADKMETLASLRHGDVEPVIAAMVAKRLVPKQNGVSDEELVRRIRGCYWKAPQPTVAGISSAITRAAHESTWRSPWAQDELQDSAGDVVQNYVRIARLAPEAVEKAIEKGWEPKRFSLDQAHDGTLDKVQVLTLTY